MQLSLGPLCITLWELEFRKLTNLLVFILDPLQFLKNNM